MFQEVFIPEVPIPVAEVLPKQVEREPLEKSKKDSTEDKRVQRTKKRNPVVHQACKRMNRLPVKVFILDWMTRYHLETSTFTFLNPKSGGLNLIYLTDINITN